MKTILGATLRRPAELSRQDRWLALAFGLGEGWMHARLGDRSGS